jgi:phage shock protein C
VNRKIGGVCGGIAEYFGIDPTMVRVITLVLFFAVGSGLLLYLIAWLIIPGCDDPYA